MVANSVAGSTVGRAAGSVYSDASIGSLQQHLFAAELQQARSMKMLQNLSRQAEAEADRQLHLAEKMAARDDQLAAFADQQEQLRHQRAAEAAVREQQHKERAELAALHEQQVREQAHHKVMAGDHRAEELAARRAEIAQHNREHAAHAAARREAAAQASAELAESRRAQLLARQEAAERIAKEREEVRTLERTIQEERAFLKQEAREAAKQRAEAELMQRTDTYVRKGQAREAALESWQQSTNAVRRLKAEEARERAEYVAMQAKLAAEADATKRAQFHAIAMAKAQRVDAILAEREALTDKMLRLRHSLVQQEQAVRDSLEALRHGHGVPSHAPGLTAALAAGAQAYSSGGGAGRGGQRKTTGYAPSTRSAHASRPATSRSVASASVGGLARSRPASASARPAHRPYTAAAPGAGFLPHDHHGHHGHYGPPGAVTGAQFYTTAGPTALGPVEQREDVLRGVLRNEMEKELQRQAILAGTPDRAEAARLAVIFQAERDAAKHRIVRLSAAVHEAAHGVRAMQLSPQLVPPGEQGQPATYHFLTPSGAAAKVRSGPARPKPLGMEPLAAAEAGGGGGQSVVSSLTGFRQVYTERRVALPDYTVVATRMEHPTMAHHHHLQRVYSNKSPDGVLTA